MGLFDKRTQKDDFDSPVEAIDLRDPEPAPPKNTAAAAVPRAHPPVRDETDYGIQKAIELMRTLPEGHVELVVQVVKFTLQSAQIRIGTIIDDAAARQERLRARMSALTSEIAELDQEIAQRRREIGGLEADYAETTTVKERLQLAEQLTRGSQPVATPASPALAQSSQPIAAISHSSETDASWIEVGPSAASDRSQPGGTPPTASGRLREATMAATAAPGNNGTR